MVTGATRWMVSLLFPSSKLALYLVVFVEAKPLTVSQYLACSLNRDPKYRYCITFLSYACIQVHCAGVLLHATREFLFPVYGIEALPCLQVQSFIPFPVQSANCNCPTSA
jgi:hypothetical protein